MYVLGISGYYHDSAAAIIEDHRIVAAAQEERFTRKKADAGFPAGAVQYCLREAGISLDDVGYVAFYDKPLLTFNRLLETYLAYAPGGFASFVTAIPVWVKEKLFLKSSLLKQLNGLGAGRVAEDRVLFNFHHHSHAASAFYPSPFDEAAILVMDGVGEWATTSIGAGSGNRVELLKEIRFPHSIGMLYSAFTYYLGFKVNDGEYKVMGLAPYGEPRYVREIYDNLVDMKPDGSYRLNMEYFNYCTGLTMTNERFSGLFGAPPRKSNAPLTQRDMDLARSVQVVTEELVLRLARTARQITGMRNLCMAGGVALNCVANGRVLKDSPFDRLWIQPASGDAGGALGAALAASYAVNGSARRAAESGDGMAGTYLGPSFDRAGIRDVLTRHKAVFHEYADDELFESVARALSEGKVVGWFQGRMEFGPRALGNRSILGDPRSRDMQRVLNLKIKYRESFRPFAPAVLREHVARYFDIDCDSAYMLLVANVVEAHKVELPAEQRERQGLARLNVARSDVPAITHVDYSARVQTVHRETNPRFYRLIEAFHALTGVPLLVNTSFNIRDEPIVCTPEEAYLCFMGTEMELLAIDNYVLRKEEQW